MAVDSVSSKGKSVNIHKKQPHFLACEKQNAYLCENFRNEKIRNA